MIELFIIVTVTILMIIISFLLPKMNNLRFVVVWGDHNGNLCLRGESAQLQLNGKWVKSRVFVKTEMKGNQIKSKLLANQGKPSYQILRVHSPPDAEIWADLAKASGVFSFSIMFISLSPNHLRCSSNLCLFPFLFLCLLALHDLSSFRSSPGHQAE